MWQYTALVTEWNKSQDSKDSIDPPTREQYYEGLERMRERAKTNPSIKV